MENNNEIKNVEEEIIILESKRSKLYNKIEEKEKELEKLKDEQKCLEYNEDWKKFEGGCFFVESYQVDGKVSNYVYKIISTTSKMLHYEYADLEAEYLADWKDSQHSRGCNKWKKITYEEYKKRIKGFKDLRRNLGNKSSEVKK